MNSKSSLDIIWLLDRMDEMIADCRLNSITSSTEGKGEFFQSFVLSYGLMLARRGLIESFSQLNDMEYLLSMRNLVEVIKYEVDFIDASRRFNLLSPFPDAFNFSWGLKLTDIGSGFSGYISDQAKCARASFINLLKECFKRLNLPLRYDAITTFLGPGGGTGKSTTIKLLMAIEEGLGNPVFESGSLEAWDRFREKIWGEIEWLTEKQRRASSLEELEIFERLKTYRFLAYMTARAADAESRMIDFFEFVYSIDRSRRPYCRAYFDTMGIAAMCSVIARSELNDIIREEGQSDVFHQLMSSSRVKIPDELLEDVCLLILHNNMFEGVLRLTGRPIIVLDMPVDKALKRSARSRKADIRKRHDPDRASLRLLSLCFSELFPQDVVVVPCAYGDGKCLSPVQVACRSIVATSFLKLGNIVRGDISQLGLFTEELDMLYRKMKVMIERIEELKSIS